MLALIPTYGFAVSNQDLMDRLDDIQIQRMIEQDIQRQQQMQNFYQDNYRLQYSPIPRDIAMEAAALYDLSLPEVYRRDELGNKTCYKLYGGLYKTESQQASNCFSSIMLQVSESEAARRNSNVDKYCKNLTGDRAFKCTKDYLVLGKKNILGIAW